MMIKTKSFELTPYDYVKINMNFFGFKFLLYPFLIAMIFWSKWIAGRDLSIVDIVFITVIITIIFLNLYPVIVNAFSNNNKDFFASREIEIDDRFLIEKRADGSHDNINLSRFRMIRESKGYYLLFNTNITFYAVKKDSFLTPEDAQNFKLNIADKLKKNGFIEL